MKARPVVTLSSVTSLRMGIGFTLSQWIVNYNTGESKPLNTNKLLGHLGYGWGIGGILYIWLVKVLPRAFPTPTGLMLLCKVAVDQAIMGPIFISSYFYCIHRSGGFSHEESVGAVESNLLPLLMTGMKVWMPTQLFNFYLVKPLYQPLVINAVGLSWNIYISYMQTSHGRVRGEAYLEP
jgi:hypothetical protein